MAMKALTDLKKGVPGKVGCFSQHVFARWLNWAYLAATEQRENLCCPLFQPVNNNIMQILAIPSMFSQVKRMLNVSSFFFNVSRKRFIWRI